MIRVWASTLSVIGAGKSNNPNVFSDLKKPRVRGPFMLNSVSNYVVVPLLLIGNGGV